MREQQRRPAVSPESAVDREGGGRNLSVQDRIRTQRDFKQGREKVQRESESNTRHLESPNMGARDPTSLDRRRAPDDSNEDIQTVVLTIAAQLQNRSFLAPTPLQPALPHNSPPYRIIPYLRHHIRRKPVASSIETSILPRIPPPTLRRSPPRHLSWSRAEKLYHRCKVPRRSICDAKHNVAHQLHGRFRGGGGGRPLPLRLAALVTPPPPPPARRRPPTPPPGWRLKRPTRRRH